MAVFRSSNIIANYNFPLIAALSYEVRPRMMVGEKGRAIRDIYERLQINLIILFLWGLFITSMAVMISDVKSIYIFYSFLIYFVLSIGLGIISAFHVGMIFAYRIGNVKVDEQPKTFWVIAVLYAVIALTFIVYKLF